MGVKSFFRRVLLPLFAAAAFITAEQSTVLANPLSSFVYPIMSPRVSSKYGMRIHPIRKFSRKHHGIDLAAPLGSPIRAVAAGIVIFADPFGSYGNLIVILHAEGVTTHYGHCESIKVLPGRPVAAGGIIGTVGSTGQSTGPHLHFEVRVNGVPHDPEKFIPGFQRRALG